ncbi:MAG: tetratricopeptide repeat protein, partial [Methylococcales bacterium]
SPLAEPTIPNNDDQILERLPVNNRDPLQRKLRAMRNALSQDSQNIELAVELARSYMKIGKSQADPRYFGYAQGLLSPWWDSSEPPSDVLLLRAAILQNRHDFQNALQDLEKLLRRDPQNSQAWLARASILQVRAEYPEAQLSCARLMVFDDTLRAATCLSQIGALTGHAADSFILLSEALDDGPAPSDEQHFWSLTVLATIAAQIGRNREADRIFMQALKLRGQDPYLLGVYTDFLLERDRSEEVVSLLKDKTRIDALLLRLALAKQRLGSSDLAELVTDLTKRFTASRLRGENIHPGDEARFSLFLLNQPLRALDLARVNWKLQREPKDIRILLEAALAARDPDAARPALDLLTRTSLEHPEIQRLAAQLRIINKH